MDSNLGEVLCEAVDTIVSKRLENLKYDITKFCTIIDNTENKLGKYVVQEEILQYDAYSTDTTLKQGDYVVVLIPNGDYNEQKIILHKVVNENNLSTSAAYVSPLKQMINFTENIIEEDMIYPDLDSGVINNKYFSLLANEKNNKNNEVMTSKLLYSIPWSDYNNYDRIGISADFQTWLKEFDTVSGEYGLELLFFTKENNSQQKSENAAYRFIFSINDIIGDPYNFPVYFTQEKIIDTSQLTDIETLQIHFYQKGNFKDGDGNYILSQDDKNNKLFDNIFVGNIKVFAGYDITEYDSDKIILNTADSLTYTRLNNDNTKNLVLHWVHKIDQYNYEIINTSNANDIEIYWVRYSSKTSDLSNMDIVGANWVHLTNELIVDSQNPFNCSLMISKDNSLIWENIIRVKAICRIKVDGNWLQYESNTITFETEDIEDAYSTIMGFSIQCDDDYKGNYFIYGNDHKIIDESQGSGHIRKFKLYHNGYAVGLDSSNIKSDDIQSIFWEVIVNDRTMLNYPQITKIDNEVVKYSTKQSPELEYTISDIWYPDMVENTVKCTMTLKNGEEYKASKTLLFGKASSQGSNYNLVIEFKDPNKNAIEIQTDNENKMQDSVSVDFIGRLYNINGIIDEPSGSWRWSLKYDDKKIMSLKNNLTQNVTLNIEKYEKGPLDSNYAILVLEYYPNSDDPNSECIKAYKPLAIKTKNTNGNRCDALSGATTITYNSMGKPQYYTGDYILYYTENGKRQEMDNIVWDIINPESKTLPIGYPKLKQSKNGKVALSANSIYVKRDYQVCIVAKDKDNIVHWIQPIHITQSAYDLAIVNDWEGSTKVGDNNIKTSSVAAGHIDNGNFNGIILGEVEIGNIDNNQAGNVGLYGISNNIVTFSLTDNGQATFQNSSEDAVTAVFLGVDNLLQSYSGNIETVNGIETGKSNYFEFNLDERYLTAKGNSSKNSGLTIAAGDTYLSLFDDNTEEKMLNFSSDKFILQTPEYVSKGTKGLQFDIKNGKINVRGDDTLNINATQSAIRVLNSTIQLSNNNWYIGTIINNDADKKLFKIGKLSIDSDGEVYYGDKTLAEYIKEQI